MIYPRTLGINTYGARQYWPDVKCTGVVVYCIRDSDGRVWQSQVPLVSIEVELDYGRLLGHAFDAANVGALSASGAVMSAALFFVDHRRTFRPARMRLVHCLCMLQSAGEGSCIVV